MSKITRKPATARSTAAREARARNARRAKRRGGSLWGSALALVPLNEHQMHRVFLAIILGGAVAMAWVVASLAGVPAMASEQVASVAARAGFQVRHVEVRGTKNLDELQIYQAVLTAHDQPMPLVDLNAVRARIMQLNWVADARVSRQLPDTIVVDVLERQPHAVLRTDNPDGSHSLALVDGDGHPLSTVSAAGARRWLVLGGEGAGAQIAALDQLLDSAPALRPQVTGADWVGNRRWDITFRSGQRLMLPEGETAPDALVRFAQLDGTHRLLGGKVASFDMRVPGRVFLRVPGRADAALAAAHAAVLAKAEAKAGAITAASGAQ